MNCEKLAAITGWQCAPAGMRSVRAVSPIPLGDGGQLIAFYISQPSDSTFYLTDASETAIHAEQEGVILNKGRIDSLNRTFGVSMAEFGSDFSIEASGTLDALQGALWDAVNAIDTMKGQVHTNRTVSGMPYSGMEIAATTHMHIWTSAADGYAEPIEPPLVELAEIITAFCQRVNLWLQSHD